MSKRSRVIRIALALVTLVLLLGAGALYCSWLLFKGGTADRAMTPGSKFQQELDSTRQKIVRNLLRGRVEYRGLEHVEGLHFQMKDLELAVRRGAKGPVRVPSLDLQLEPTTLAVSGFLNSTPIIKAFLGSRFQVIEVPDEALLPVHVRMSPMALLRKSGWSILLNLVGKTLNLRLHSSFKPVPILFSAGEVNFSHDVLTLDDLAATTGRSQLRLMAHVRNPLGEMILENTDLTGHFEIADVMVPQTPRQKAPAAGILDFKLGASGPLDRAILDGSVSGDLSFEGLPVDLGTAEDVQFSRINLQNLEAHIRRDPGRESLARIDMRTQKTELVLATSLADDDRRIGLSSQPLSIGIIMRDTWRTPSMECLIASKQGMVAYGKCEYENRKKVCGEFQLPYENLELGLDARRNSFKFDLRSFQSLGAAYRGSLTIENGKVDGTLNLSGVDLSKVSRQYFHPSVRVSGVTDMSVVVSANDLSLASLEGRGSGAVKGFRLNWSPIELRPGLATVVRLLNGIVVPIATMDIPRIYHGIFFNFRGLSGQTQVSLKLAVSSTLEFDGSLTYEFPKSLILTSPELSTALGQLGLGNVVRVKIRGPMGHMRASIDT